MSDRIKVQVSKLEGSPLAERGKFSQAYEYTPPEEDLLKKRGRLFVVLDVKADPAFDTALAGKLVWDSLSEEYHSEGDDPPLKALERAVLSAQNRLVNLHYSSDELGAGGEADLNLAAAVVWGDSPAGEAGLLYLARQGKPTIFLKRGGQVREMLVGEEPSSVASLVVEDGDTVILGSQDFGKNFNPANLPEISFFEKEFTSGHQVPGMAATILKLKVGGKEVEEKIEKKEEEVPFDRPKQAPKLPIISDWLERLPKKRESLPFPADKIKETVARSVAKAKEIGHSVFSRIRGGVVGLGGRVATGVQARISRGEEIFLERRRPEIGLSKVIAALILVLLLSVSFTVWKQRRKARVEEFDRLLVSIEETIAEAGDVAGLSMSRAGELWREAKSDLEKVVSINSKDERISGLKQKLGDLYNLIEKITPVTEENLFYDLALRPFDSDQQAQALSIAGLAGTVYIAEEKTGATLAVSQGVPSGTPQVEEATANEIKGARRVAAGDAFLYLLTGDGFQRYNLSSREVDSPLNFDRCSAVVSFDIYNGNIYLLVPSENQIYKFLNLGQTYSRALNWVKDPLVLEAAIDIAIDGAVWVLNGDGSVIKLLQGKQEPFAFGDLTAAIDEPVAIYTRPSFTMLYLAERDRVLVLSKEGRFEKQLKGEVLTDIVDIWVTDDEKTLFILTRDKIFMIGL